MGLTNRATNRITIDRSVVIIMKILAIGIVNAFWRACCKSWAALLVASVILLRLIQTDMCWLADEMAAMRRGGDSQV